MSEKTGKITFFRNIVVLSLEIAVLVWIMVLLRTSEISLRRNKKGGDSSSEDPDRRLERNPKLSEIFRTKSGNSALYQKLFDLWRTSFVFSKDLKQRQSLSKEKQQTQSSNILKHLGSQGRILKVGAFTEPASANNTHRIIWLSRSKT